MSFTDYVKEKWYMLAFLMLSLIFSASVYYLDKQAFLNNPSSLYILYGIALFIFIFIVIDFIILRYRGKKTCCIYKKRRNGGDRLFFSYR